MIMRRILSTTSGLDRSDLGQTATNVIVYSTLASDISLLSVECQGKTAFIE